MPKLTSIVELEHLLGKQKKRLKQLQTKKGLLTGQIARIDKQIESLLGKPGKPAKPAAPRKVRRRKRGAKSLEQCLVDALSKSAEPKTAAETAKAVTEAGYKSKSKDFVALVGAATPPPRVVKKKKAPKKKKAAAK